MKKLLIALILNLTCMGVFAQNGGTATAPIKVPPTQAAALKEITDRQAKLAEAWNQLEAQKVMVVQRAALELGLNAKQLDALEVVPVGDGFEFRPKKVEAVKEAPK